MENFSFKLDKLTEILRTFQSRGGKDMKCAKADIFLLLSEF